MSTDTQEILRDRIPQNIKIKFRSFNADLLDLAVSDVVATVQKTGISMIGPVPLPNKGYVFTTNRSPHRHAKSKDKFAIHKHCRMLVLFGANNAAIEVISSVNLPSGVGIEIELSANKS